MEGTHLRARQLRAHKVAYSIRRLRDRVLSANLRGTIRFLGLPPNISTMENRSLRVGHRLVDLFSNAIRVPTLPNTVLVVCCKNRLQSKAARPIRLCQITDGSHVPSLRPAHCPRYGEALVPHQANSLKGDAGETVLFPFGSRRLVYWNEAGLDNVMLLEKTVANLEELGRQCSTGDGFRTWDVEVGSLWSRVRVRSVTENHGGKKRLIRIAFQTTPTLLSMAALLFSALLVASIYVLNAGSLLGLMITVTLGGALCLSLEATGHIKKVGTCINRLAQELNLMPLSTTNETG